MSIAKQQAGSVRFCANNFSRHPDTKPWIHYYKDSGWQVQLTGCMGLCSTCRVSPMCIENDKWDAKELGAYTPDEESLE